jgi:nucleoside-diphosphate-sugar epimerase
VLVNNIAWVLRHMPAFALPGDGRYLVQPVHVDDVARICTEAASVGRDVVLDAAGPEAMPFAVLIAMIRRAVDAHVPVLHVPALVMATAARVLGMLVRDVVLTPDEIRGLMAGLLASAQEPRGELTFSGWLEEHRDSVGRSYANELGRHFALAG